MFLDLLCVDLPSVNMLPPYPAIKLINITVSPMLLLKQFGFEITSLSYTFLCLVSTCVCHNVNVVYSASNLVKNPRTKHVEIGLHFVRKMLLMVKFVNCMFSLTLAYKFLYSMLTTLVVIFILDPILTFKLHPLRTTESILNKLNKHMHG